ncbi:MAG: phospholipase C [Dehalococcoidia bacterium]
MRITTALKLVLATVTLAGAGLTLAPAGTPAGASERTANPATSIRHLVVIYQENVSFDHYFGTYPQAANPAGQPPFFAAGNTPSVNGLGGPLLASNPNAAAPFRLDRTQAHTCDQDHGYRAEQLAANRGLMDKFVESTGATYGACQPTQVMGYFDGNTVTGLWNYAQHFAMSDNSFGTTFGPSTVGALNLIAGQTHGVDAAKSSPPSMLGAAVANSTVIGDPQPAFDDCSTRDVVAMSSSNKNVGDLLNARGLTWGWFEGGFRPTSTVNGKAVCGASHIGSGGTPMPDYIPHHEPFQYYAATANPHHLPPTSVAMIGRTDRANHQYDLTDFWAAADSGRMPAVSFLKAPAYQDGHAGYSDPLAEQRFLVDTINHLQQLPEWSSTAVVIAYDDSDGWYDHAMSPIVNHSQDAAHDALSAPGACGAAAPAGGYQDRCGYGPRLPLLVISPFAKVNFVDHSITDQSSILRFIEDNWGIGRIGDHSFDAKAGSLTNMFDFSGERRARTLVLDPTTGQPATREGDRSRQD